MRKIHLWAYSWIRPNYLNNYHKYRISKFLLNIFIHSAAVLDAAEGNHDFFQCIHMCFHQLVYVHDEMYMYYKRKLIRLLEVSYSSPPEVICSWNFVIECLFLTITKLYYFNHGTIFGLKNTVLQCNQPWTWTHHHIIQTNENVIQYQSRRNWRDQTWSSLLTSKYTTTFAEGIIAGIMACASIYSCKQIKI